MLQSQGEFPDTGRGQVPERRTGQLQCRLPWMIRSTFRLMTVGVENSMATEMVEAENGSTAANGVLPKSRRG